MGGLTPGLIASMWRVQRIYKALGCKSPATLFHKVLHDGRFVDELISIVYERPELMQYFKRSWNVFIDILYRCEDAFDAVMDRVVKSLDDTIAVDVNPDSLRDFRVGRVLVHMLERYPGKFVFLIGGRMCCDDIAVLNVFLRTRGKFDRTLVNLPYELQWTPRTKPSRRP